MSGLPQVSRGTALETMIIFTTDMEALAAFYQEGLELGSYQRSPQHMGQQVGPVYLGFDEVESLEGNARANVSLWFTVENLQATYDRLVGLGASVRYPPVRKPWGGYLACVYDPDGNMLGLSQREL
jgi:predicted enzyme related to lactoylglutathione lyase